MISSSRNLPLIQNALGVAVPFEHDWLKAALAKAARKAGYESWWLLDEFSSTVSLYLQHSYQPNVIDLRNLEKVVRGTLRDIGYHEIAVCFRTVNPFQSMSLADCLKESRSANGQSLFFKRLSERIETLHAAKVQHFHFYDLRPCVQRLLEGDQMACWWSDPLLREHIVSFVRDEMRSRCWNQKVQCSIS